MAQYDVYRNPTASAREAIPYLVNVQSELLDDLPTRLTVPLGNRIAAPHAGPKSLCPLIEFDGQALFALPHLAAAFRVRDLGKPQGSVARHASQLVAAADAVISGV